MNELCFGIVLDDVEEAIRRVAKAMETTQLHTLYIDPVPCGTVHHFGERLGQALASHSLDAALLTDEELGAIRHLRGSYAFRAENDPRVSIQMSEDLHGWTVICEEEPLFALGSGPRHLYIKPVPESYDEALLYVRPQLRRALVWPLCESSAIKLRSLPDDLEVRSL